jgi:hypothetical protein
LLAPTIPEVPYTIEGGEVRQAVMRVAPLRDLRGEIAGIVGLAAPAKAGAMSDRRR